MSYYPADNTLISQHDLYDVPDKPEISLRSRALAQSHSAGRVVLLMVIVVLWAAALYCLFKALHIFSQWAIQATHKYIRSQRESLSDKPQQPLSSITSGKITSQFAYYSKRNQYSNRNSCDDDLESQLSNSSTTSIPGLSYTPDISSPSSSASSPPLSAISSFAEPESFAKRITPDSFLPAPRAKNISAFGIVDPYDPSLVDHSMIKIH